jgi:hypothetical protein
MALGKEKLVEDGSSVRADTAQSQNEEAAEPTVTESSYKPEERTAIDQANEAFGIVIKAVDTLEDIEAWVPPVVRGVRALRDRAMRETGALNYLDHEYRRKFGKLLKDEPIGPWLLDERRRSLLNALHHLGSEDTYLDTFMDWRATTITEEQRRKWCSLRTLVDHFKDWQTGAVPSNDRRTADQKAIERVRTEGHEADAARLAEVNQVRQELATQAIKTTGTLGTILAQAGPEMEFQAIREYCAKDHARALYELLGGWLKEPTT